MWEVTYKESWVKYWYFELWCWRRLLRVPWTARWSNQSILKEISLEYSLEGPMLKLKLRSFGHMTRRTDSFAKTLMPGKIEEGREGDDRGWDGWMASLTRWTWVWVSSGRRWRKGKPGKLQSMGCQRVGHDWVTELNWLTSGRMGNCQAILLEDPIVTFPVSNSLYPAALIPSLPEEILYNPQRLWRLFTWVDWICQINLWAMLIGTCFGRRSNEEKWKAKEKKKDISIWRQSCKEYQGEKQSLPQWSMQRKRGKQQNGED